MSVSFLPVVGVLVGLGVLGVGMGVVVFMLIKNKQRQ